MLTPSGSLPGRTAPSRRGFLLAAGGALAGTLLPTRPAAARARKPAAYFPRPESLGGWRRLVGTGAAPSPVERDQIRRLAGIDWSRLVEAHTYSESFRPGSALLVIRRGWIVGEWGPTGPFFVASVSKSLTALAAARAFELSRAMRRGKIIGPETLAAEFLPASFAARDPHKRSIRLGHLLSMTSGLEPDDDPYRPDYTLERVLDRPALAEPGHQWAYCSATTDLLGLVVRNATGRSLAELFDTELGAPIGTAPIAWDNLEGTERACCAARISARDLARIGWLLMHEGRWQDPGGRKLRLLRKGTARLLTRPSKLAGKARFAPTPNSPFPFPAEAREAFAEHWWTNAGGVMLGPAVPHDAFYAHGFRENLLIVVPSLELVVVRLGSAPDALPEFRSELVARVMAALV